MIIQNTKSGCFFDVGMVVAQGAVEEMKKDIPEVEIAKKKESAREETEEETEHEEADDDLAEAEQLREAEEDREVGSVSFMVDAKYFMFGAPALVLLLILLIIVSGQGNFFPLLTSWYRVCALNISFSYRSHSMG